MSDELTRYFRLPDRTRYTGCQGSADEMEWAYCMYDEFLTLFVNKLILSRH